jgi:hypothetical protein
MGVTSDFALVVNELYCIQNKHRKNNKDKLNWPPLSHDVRKSLRPFAKWYH